MAIGYDTHHGSHLLSIIAKANGFLALEWSRAVRRQTPFAKWEIRWSRGVLAGDTITSTRRLFEKNVRRGSRFITFRVGATNQNGAEVAEYDYTCIFDYCESRQDAPQETRDAETSSPDTVGSGIPGRQSETWATNSRP